MKWRSLEQSNPSTDPRPLREIYAERKDLIAKYVPTETQKVHADAVAELKQRNLAANILAVRAKARSSNSTIMTANSSVPSIY